MGYEIQKGKKGWAVWEVQGNGFETRVSDWYGNKSGAQSWVSAQSPVAKEEAATEEAEGPAVERTEDNVTVLHVPTVEFAEVACEVCSRPVSYNHAGPVPDTCKGCLDTACFDYEPAGDGYLSSRKQMVESGGPRADKKVATAMRMAVLEDQ